jgi:hypothetical protein
MTDAGAERQRVRALIERAGVAMLMSVDEKGTHIGRPMLPLFIQSDPHMYFLTHQNSRKVVQLAVHPQSKQRSERDQLRMPHGEKRSPMDAAGSSKDRVGRYTRKSLIKQMLVSCATAERARIRPAGIPVLRLDEHQRRGRSTSGCTHEAEFASVVPSTPRIPDALQA